MYNKVVWHPLFNIGIFIFLIYIFLSRESHGFLYYIALIVNVFCIAVSVVIRGKRNRIKLRLMNLMFNHVLNEGYKSIHLTPVTRKKATPNKAGVISALDVLLQFNPITISLIDTSRDCENRAALVFKENLWHLYSYVESPGISHEVVDKYDSLTAVAKKIVSHYLTVSVGLAVNNDPRATSSKETLKLYDRYNKIYSAKLDSYFKTIWVMKILNFSEKIASM